jgi:hypothetical protein
MDIQKFRLAVERFESALIINHLIFLAQLWMLSWQRSAFSVVCTLLTAGVLVFVWVVVYSWYKML